jgi:hypothetical protein
MIQTDTHSFVQALLCLQLILPNKRHTPSKEKLGHRSIENTLIYTHLVDWEQPDTWTVRRPATSKEEDELIATGFEYVRFDDTNQCLIYRKRN